MECRSCGAPVTWTLTVKGKRIPLNPEPVPDGNIVPVIIDGERRARVVTEANPAPDGVQRFKSHYATCPQADEWRKP